MKLADLHADIGYDIMEKQKKGIYEHILRDHHIKKFQIGEIGCVCMASFFDGTQSWQQMQEMVSATRREIDHCEDVSLVLTGEDTEKEGILAIMSVEGMCGIQERPKEKIRWLYEQGVRIASLCWNEENMLAGGVGKADGHGLTELGREGLEEMRSLGMILDLSHANEKTFWDCMEYEDLPVIATHSNCRELCDHPRNLWKEQARAILRRQGLIGMNSAPSFVHKDKRQQTALQLARHALFLKELNEGSVEGIACGFDFMDFYDDYDGYCQDLRDCTQAQNFIEALRHVGFSLAERERIAYGNVKDFLKRRL